MQLCWETHHERVRRVPFLNGMGNDHETHQPSHVYNTRHRTVSIPITIISVIRCSFRVYCWLPHPEGFACSDHCAIIVTLNFDQLPMTPAIERQIHKKINWKFKDAGLKIQLYQRMDSMLDAAPGGLLRVNRGTDTNRLTDLLTFESKGVERSWIPRVSEPLEYCGAPQKWSTCRAEM